jgi:hypothetical protein
VWAANSKARVVGLPKLVGSHIMTSYAQMLEMELQNLIFAFLGFCLALVQSLLSFSPF